MKFLDRLEEWIIATLMAAATIVIFIAVVHRYLSGLPIPALQAHIVDGTENPPSNMLTQRMHEVQKYVTVSNHGYLGYAVIVNKKFWDGLPRDIRVQLEQAMKEATAYEKTIAQRDNDAALEAIRASGKTKVYTLSPQEQAEWRQALLPVQKQVEGRIGKDLIDAINRTTAQPAVRTTAQLW